jgi:hypothetical protein
VSLNIQDFYLIKAMARPVFMQVALTDIPAVIIDHYSLELFADHSLVYCEIEKDFTACPKQAS